MKPVVDGQAEIGDDSIETKSVDQGHPDLGGPESTPNFSTPESENLGGVRDLSRLIATLGAR